MHRRERSDVSLESSVQAFTHLEDQRSRIRVPPSHESMLAPSRRGSCVKPPAQRLGLSCVVLLQRSATSPTRSIDRGALPGGTRSKPTSLQSAGSRTKYACTGSAQVSGPPFAAISTRM